MRKIRLIFTGLAVALCAVFALAGCGGGLVNGGNNGGQNGSNGSSNNGGTSVDYSAGLAYTAVKENGETVGYEVSRGDNNTTTVVIPNTVGDVPVIKIAEKGFENCNDIVRITIPANVTEIGVNAFTGCDKLANIVFAETEGWTIVHDEKDIETVPLILTTDSQAAATHMSGSSEFLWKRVTSVS